MLVYPEGNHNHVADQSISLLHRCKLCFGHAAVFICPIWVLEVMFRARQDPPIEAWRASRGNIRDWSHPADQREAEYLGPKMQGLAWEHVRDDLFIVGINGMKTSMDFHRLSVISFWRGMQFRPCCPTGAAARAIVAWWLLLSSEGFFLPSTITTGILVSTNQVLWGSLVVRLDKPSITSERLF